jgi:hypothetical protein
MGKYEATSPPRVTTFRKRLPASRDLMSGNEKTNPAVRSPTNIGANIPVAIP